MVYSYNKILQINKDEPTAATHHNVDQFDNHHVEHKNSHKEVNILCGFMDLKLKKKKKTKSQNSSYSEAEGVSDWEGLRGS